MWALPKPIHWVFNATTHAFTVRLPGLLRWWYVVGMFFFKVPFVIFVPRNVVFHGMLFFTLIAKKRPTPNWFMVARTQWPWPPKLFFNLHLRFSRTRRVHAVSHPHQRTGRGRHFCRDWRLLEWLGQSRSWWACRCPVVVRSALTSEHPDSCRRRQCGLEAAVWRLLPERFVNLQWHGGRNCLL